MGISHWTEYPQANSSIVWPWPKHYPTSPEYNVLVQKCIPIRAQRDDENKKKNSEKHDEQNTHKIIRKDADFTTAAPYQVPGHRGQSRVPRQEEYNFSIITILKPLSFSLLRRVPSVSVLPASQQSSVAPVMVNARPMAKQWTWTNLQWV